MTKQIIKNIILFILFGCFYVTIEVFFRGYSYPLMFLVAGIASVLIDKLNNKISWDMSLPLQVIIGTVIILILELTSGLFALHVLGVRMWDYRNMPWNIFEGLLCPQFALIWMIMTLGIIVMADAINYYWLHDEERPYYVLRRNGKKYYLPERNCN